MHVGLIPMLQIEFFIPSRSAPSASSPARPWPPARRRRERGTSWRRRRRWRRPCSRRTRSARPWAGMRTLWRRSTTCVTQGYLQLSTIIFQANNTWQVPALLGDVHDNDNDDHVHRDADNLLLGVHTHRIWHHPLLDEQIRYVQRLLHKYRITNMWLYSCLMGNMYWCLILD